ncbi:HEAT repeat domain-containing protein [Streptomyces sp. NBC_00690]|uniref:HEAT repeat domain-containing protein n=1 Tax=Streptomyces sp. NBC_00690 TaxID=2975808 RepID=UPI002E2A3D8D|nr:hypothetical protein [Streptomyces sp. NBC_00690]
MKAIEDLADRGMREAARDVLAAMGQAAVQPLLRELLRESSPVRPWEIEFVVTTKIGLAAYNEVLTALAQAMDQESRRRIGGVFTGFRAVERYIEALSHPSAHVRNYAAVGIQFARAVPPGRPPQPGQDLDSVIEALIPVLADPHPEVAQRVEWVLTMLGPGVIEPLRKIRRDGPGALRARALTVLASVGGEQALSGHDLAAVERLIRIKVLGEQAIPLDTCSLSWIAVPGGDRMGIMEVLSLWDQRQCTFALGHSVVAHDSVDVPAYGRVYVTPQVDGWTLLLGPWCSPVDPERAEDVLRLVAELSRRYDQAQAYYFGEQGGGSGWLVAEAGQVVRRFFACWGDDEARFALGDPLLQETAWRTEMGLASSPGVESADDDPAEQWEDRAAYLAPELAQALGVSPFNLGPHTQVRGTGTIALTPYAREHGKPRTGAYRI